MATNPVLEALARASASTAAARADLIALDNGSAIRARVAEQMERRARQPVGPALAKRLASADGRVDPAALDAAVTEICVAANLILDLPTADKRQPAVVRGALEQLAVAVQAALQGVGR